MGKIRTYKCSQCGYTIETSGGQDIKMLCVTDTYICTSCKNIVDVVVGQYGITYKKEEITLLKHILSPDLDFYACPECGSETHLVKWNNKKRPCPQCGGKMEVDPNGEVFCID